MLKCGIEIHQRLSTEKKLFCNCPASAEGEEKPTGAVTRRLKPVYGELGQVDPAAAFEGTRNKSFEYQIMPTSSCLVELDEEPPGETNLQALLAVLEIALLLNARVLDEVHVMRKTVVDGSATSGFQRTALVAVDGSLQTSFGNVAIPTICLEEESSGIVRREADKNIYRLDRLGIPLVEIATDPSISSGSQAREVAEKIGLLLRSTGRAQRGIGSIRQDLNVSVEGGTRVEIKGAQELADLSKLVENEASRQRRIIEIMNALSKRPGELHAQLPIDVSELFDKTESNFVKKALAQGNHAMATRLKGFAGLLKLELMPDHRLGTELSDYAKAHAGVQGIIHSDEDPSKYDFTPQEMTAVGQKLECNSLDGWALCIADVPTATKALDAVAQRAKTITTIGVLGETRRAEGEKSRFMRPLPGSARMYPETDVPTLEITQDLLAKVEKGLPETFEQKAKRYELNGLSKQVAHAMAKSATAEEFEKLCEHTTAEPVLVASLLLETITALARQGVEINTLSFQDKSKALKGVVEGKIVKAALAPILAEIAKGKTFEEVSEQAQYRKMNGIPLEAAISAKAKASGLRGEDLFTTLMKEHRNHADPAEMRAILSKHRMLDK